MMTNPRVDFFRRKHPRFTYESFAVERLGDTLKFRFQFRIEPDLLFAPETTIGSIDWAKIDSLGVGTLERLIFHLGLVEMLSYWKATCSPEIIVKAGFLDKQQVAWWRDLLLHGMREFFYVNKINFKNPDFLKISVPGHHNEYTHPYDVSLPPDRDLVLVGGGKDSALTLQLLREGAKQFNCLLLNPTQAAAALTTQAGCQASIIVQRSIDSRLLDLNKAGYLNGHTPFSAYLAILGVTCAVLFGYPKVIVSNERSSDEANVEFLGSEVNHQYSKTFRFESTFQWYTQTYLASHVSYFSFLRPLYEIQIARLFANYPQYFDIFRSCNRNQGDNSWCRRCAKCVFCFIALSPFLRVEDLIRIFGEDLFEQDEVVPLIQELVGLSKHKPFECVGTREEVLAVLYLSLQQAKARREALPAVLCYVEAEILPQYPNAPQLAEKVLSAWSDRHMLPQEYAGLLRSHLAKNNGTL